MVCHILVWVFWSILLFFPVWMQTYSSYAYLHRCLKWMASVALSEHGTRNVDETRIVDDRVQSLMRRQFFYYGRFLHT